jgi:ABC-type branched-subunit amino acid transport system ATPase component
MTEPLLRIEGLTKRFGGVVALDAVSFAVYPNDLVGLIGPNGSGKTTLFNCVTGFLRPDPPSEITVMGERVNRWRPDQIARLGLVRTFQEIRVFKELSLVDNLLMSLQQHQEDRLVRRFLNTAEVRQFEERGRARARELLAMVNLSSHADRPAGALSYGQRKLLILVAALMPEPPLILLDEPAAAVNPVLIDEMKEHIVNLNESGTTFLLVEHNMDVVMDICKRVIVLDHGEKIAEGSPAAIQANEQVINAYFGT